MIIKKILNNNVVLVSDDDFEKEQIVMQNGIGFNKKVGDEIFESKNQQIFVLSDSLYKKYEHLTNNTDPISAQIAEKVISYAEEKYQLELNEMIHLTLTDHIDGVISRFSKGIVLRNELKLEISRIYTQEYKVGLYAIKQLNEIVKSNDLGDEAAFIAMHILNNRLDFETSEEQIKTSLGFISDIIKVVEIFFNKKYDETLFSYYRFVMHLKGLVKRMYSKNVFEEDEVLYKTLVAAYPEPARCAEKVAKMIFLKYSLNISSEEKAFLTLYIEKLNREYK